MGLIPTAHDSDLIRPEANLRAARQCGESPALRLTRYFCNRGLVQPTPAMASF